LYTTNLSILLSFLFFFSWHSSQDLRPQGWLSFEQRVLSIVVLSEVVIVLSLFFCWSCVVIWFSFVQHFLFLFDSLHCWVAWSLLLQLYCTKNCKSCVVLHSWVETTNIISYQYHREAILSGYFKNVITVNQKHLFRSLKIMGWQKWNFY